MCGRFTQANPEALQQAFDLPDLPPARYNIAPSQNVLAMRHDGPQMLRWGLLPSWAKDRSLASKLSNARAETLHEKPSFKNAFKKRRCIIPADGFYEWQTDSEGKKTPHYIGMADRSPFALAGIWESWQDAQSGESLQTFALITTTPNELMQPIHDRMPVILPRQHFAAWLDPQFDETTALRALLLPYPAEAMSAYAVSLRVNSAKNDDPSLIHAL